MESKRIELEKKRQRLQELKRAREERQSRLENAISDPLSCMFSKRDLKLQRCSISRVFTWQIDEPPVKNFYEKFVQTDAFEELESDDGVDASSAQLSDEDVKHMEVEFSEPSAPTETIPLPTASVDRTLSFEERKRVLESPSFHDFLTKSSRVVERVVRGNLEYDVLQDYARVDSGLESGVWASNVHLACTISPPMEASRPVFSLDWSTYFPELLLASYGSLPQDESLPTDAGLNLYNIHVPERPEYSFTSDSAVTSACFSPLSPYLLYGGTFSGQVLQWDTRAQKAPILSSNRLATSGGHSFPIFALNVAEGGSANHIISTSSDGTVCVWQLNMFSKPLQCYELRAPVSALGVGAARTAPVAVSCALSLPTLSNHFIVGSQRGSLFAVKRVDSLGVRAGVDASIHFSGVHSSPVTSLSCSRGQGDYFISSSMDWTVKLWKPAFTAHSSDRISSSPNKSGAKTVYESELKLESFGCPVMDAQFSPRVANLFSTADVSGALKFWDLNNLKKTEAPIACYNLEGCIPNVSSWNRASQNHLVAVGATNGIVSVIDSSKVVSTLG